jgi:hypothetical protein
MKFESLGLEFHGDAIERGPDPVSELLARIVLRDACAFETLYRRVAGRLMAVALRVMQDRAAAEDVLQEVFASIWNRSAAAAPGQHRTLAWLCVVTRHRAIDLLRKRRPEEPLHWRGEQGEEQATLTCPLSPLRRGLVWRAHPSRKPLPLAFDFRHLRSSSPCGGRIPPPRPSKGDPHELRSWPWRKERPRYRPWSVRSAARGRTCRKGFRRCFLLANTSVQTARRL